MEWEADKILSKTKVLLLGISQTKLTSVWKRLLQFNTRYKINLPLFILLLILIPFLKYVMKLWSCPWKKWVKIKTKFFKNLFGIDYRISFSWQVASTIHDKQCRPIFGYWDRTSSPWNFVETRCTFAEPPLFANLILKTTLQN